MQQKSHYYWALLGAFALGSVSTCYAEVKLNNFVIEFVNIENPQQVEFTIEFKQPGWLFVRTFGGEPGTSVALDSPDDRLIEYRADMPAVQESMRFVAAGRHVVKVETGRVERLQVRRIPEIRYCRFQYDPWVHQEGPFDWAFLEQHVLPHVNTIVGTVDEDQSRFAEPWRAAGKRWIIESLAPGIHRPKGEQKTGITADEVYRELTDESQLDRPWVDGLLVDEYLASMKQLFAPTVDAVRRVHADPSRATKRVDLYVSGNSRGIGQFVSDSIDAGATIALEAYNPEQPTEAEARAYLEAHMTRKMAAFAKLRPDIAEHMVIALGIYSTPPETLDVDPAVNDRVFRDLEFQLLANDPAFEGLGGVMNYTSGYASEETIRWIGQLFRHYCIEGRTDRLGQEPYLLGHVANGDFSDRLNGWEIAPAAADSIATRTIAGLGELEGRYDSPGVGDQCAVMSRQRDRCNQVRQSIKELEPGNIYSLQMFSFDLNQGRAQYGNPTLDDVSGIDIDVADVEWIDEGCYDHQYRSIHTDKPMFFNYHVRRFRAMKPESTLTISDWKDPARRRENIGRETGINFVQVQPYFDNKDD